MIMIMASILTITLNHCRKKDVSHSLQTLSIINCLPGLSRSIEPESPVSRWHRVSIVQLDPPSAVEHWTIAVLCEKLRCLCTFLLLHDRCVPLSISTNLKFWDKSWRSLENESCHPMSSPPAVASEASSFVTSLSIHPADSWGSWALWIPKSRKVNQQKRCLFSRVSVRKPFIHHPCGIFSWKTRGDVHETLREKNLVQMAKQCLDRVTGSLALHRNDWVPHNGRVAPWVIQTSLSRQSFQLYIHSVSHVFLYQFTGGRKLPMSSPIWSQAVGELPKDCYSSGDFS